MSYSIDQFKAVLSLERGLASANMYRVVLPTLAGKTTMNGTPIQGYSNETINLICKATSLPGRQVMTLDRQMGMTNVKVAHGFAVQDVALTFQCTNSYMIRRYFEDWQSLAISNFQGVQYHSGYFNDYTQNVRIAQIRKPESFVVKNFDLGFDLNLPPAIRDSLPTIGGVDLGDLTEGRFDIAIVSDENVVYECLLQNAFPVSLTEISMTNEPDQISEFTVSLAYKNWFDISPGTTETLSDTILDAINDLAGSTASIIADVFGFGP